MHFKQFGAATILEKIERRGWVQGSSENISLHCRLLPGQTQKYMTKWNFDVWHPIELKGYRESEVAGREKRYVIDAIFHKKICALLMWNLTEICQKFALLFYISQI